MHGYEQWGERCVDRFRGMFAFALWDAQARAGCCSPAIGSASSRSTTPRCPAAIVFGSEIKSLLEDPEVPREWRADAIDAYLTLLYVPAPDTIYRGIHKLPPAHVLVAERGQVRTSNSYWDLEFTGDGDERARRGLPRGARRALREAVRLRLISDVPLGAFLSGGIDSSTVVAYMVEASDTPPVDHSVGFDDQAFDEVEHAETVARHLGCEFHALIAKPACRGAAAEAGVALRRAVRATPPPCRPTTCRRPRASWSRSRCRATAATSCGPATRATASSSWEQRVRGCARPGGVALAGLARPGAAAARSRARDRCGTSRSDPDQAYALKHAYGMFEPGREGRSSTRGDFRAHGCNGYDPLRQLPRRVSRHARRRDPLDRALYVDVQTYMIDDVLTKVDRMSMAVSLEAREPLLDHKLLEFAARVPASLKLKDGRSKYLLRRLLEKRVPRVDHRAQEAAASRRRSANGCVGRSRRWPTSCCSTAGCAIAASSNHGEVDAAVARASHRPRAIIDIASGSS